MSVSIRKARFRGTKRTFRLASAGNGYLYAFDDGFDVAEDVYRLETAINPYQPE